MAVVYQTEEEEKKKELAGQGVQTQGQPLGEEPEGGLQTGGGTGSLVQGSGGGAASPSQRGTSSGSFTNLQSYLDANKNENLGQNIAGRIQGEVDQAKAAQQSAGQGFRGLVDQAKVGTDQSLLDRIKQDARSVAGSETDKTAFEKMRDAQYKGPGSLMESQDLYNPAYKETAEAQEQLDASKSLEGRKSLLKNIGGAQYSKGQAKLDNLLLQNDPNARNAFQNLQSGNQNLQADYDKLLSELGDYAGKAKTETKGAKAGALKSLEEGLSTQKLKGADRLTSRVKDAELTKTYQDMLRNRDFTGLGASSEERANKAKEIFGIDPRETAAYDFDGSHLMTGIDPSVLNEDAVRTPEEAEIMRALGALGGDTSGFNLGAAGTYDDEALWNMDQGGLKQGLQGRKNAIEDEATGASNTARNQAKAESDQAEVYNQQIPKHQQQIAYLEDELRRSPVGNTETQNKINELKKEIVRISALSAKHQAAAIHQLSEGRKTEEAVKAQRGYGNRFKF